MLIKPSSDPGFTEKQTQKVKRKPEPALSVRKGSWLPGCKGRCSEETRAAIKN